MVFTLSCMQTTEKTAQSELSQHFVFHTQSWTWKYIKSQDPLKCCHLEYSWECRCQLTLPFHVHSTTICQFECRCYQRHKECLCIQCELPTSCGFCSSRWPEQMRNMFSCAYINHVPGCACMCSQLSQLPPIVYYMWKSNTNLSSAVNYTQLHNLSPQPHLQLTTYDYC